MALSLQKPQIINRPNSRLATTLIPSDNGAAELTEHQPFLQAILVCDIQDHFPPTLLSVLITSSKFSLKDEPCTNNSGTDIRCVAHHIESGAGTSIGCFISEGTAIFAATMDAARQLWQ